VHDAEKSRPSIVVAWWYVILGTDPFPEFVEINREIHSLIVSQLTDRQTDRLTPSTVTGRGERIQAA